MSGTRGLIPLLLLLGCAAACGSKTAPTDAGTPDAGDAPDAPPEDDGGSNTPIPAGPPVEIDLHVIGPGKVVTPGGTCWGTDICEGTRVGVESETVRLDAIPTGTNNTFHHWEGACTGSSPRCALTLAEGEKPAIVAWFGPTGVDPPPPPLVPVIIRIAGSGAGDVTAEGYEVRCEAQQPTKWTIQGCNVDLPYLTPVKLQAHARPGSRFRQWLGGSSSSGDYTLTAGLPSRPPGIEPNATVVFDSAPKSPQYRLDVYDFGRPDARAFDFRAGRIAGYFPGSADYVFDVDTGALEFVTAPEFRPYGLDGAGELFGRDTRGRCLLSGNGVQLEVPPLPGHDSCRLRSVNRRGHALGASRTGTESDWSTFFFDGRQTVDVSTLAGVPPDFEATALGEDDAIGGSYYQGGNERAGWIINGVFQDVGSLGGSSTWVTAIGPGGHVIGGSSTINSNGAGDGYHAFIWDGSNMTDLGKVHDGWFWSFALSVNRDGFVVGVTDTACVACDYTRSRAFVAKHGTGVDLNELVDTGPYELVGVVGIDDAGRIVGNAQDWSGRGERSAIFLLTPID